MKKKTKTTRKTCKNRGKRWLVALAVLACVAVLLTVAGPHLVLLTARQPEVAETYAYSDSFCTTYDEARANFQKLAENLRAENLPVTVGRYAVDESDGLYIDNLYIPAGKEEKNLIILTTGVHGIEGYIGAAMLDVFFAEVFPTLNTETTGLLVVANVNPYGMKYLRRFNENNVDLNRNFILDWDSFDKASNKDYPDVKEFLQPEGKMGNALWNEVGFYAKLAKEAVTSGADKVSDALLTGQYQYPEGVYYGGNGDEISTAYLKGVFNDCLDGVYGNYENLVHLDIHSGYGPRYNMVIFNAVYETMTEAETKVAFGYDYVIAHDSESFYATVGDTSDYFYRLAKSKNTDKALFSTCFEFGTLGDSFFDSILSLKYTVEENRQNRYPTDNAITAEVLMERYKELYYPTETLWREKAVENFVAATNGVLTTKLK